MNSFLELKYINYENNKIEDHNDLKKFIQNKGREKE